MEHQLRSSSSDKRDNKCKLECNLSKKKQALKKCINELGAIREKGLSPALKVPGKIAAPKPIKARPSALIHIGNSKWIQTSPAKIEFSQETISANVSQQDVPQLDVSSQKESKKDALQDFQEQSLCQVQMKKGRRKSPMSELESHMLAEEELSSIFSKSTQQDSLYMNQGFRLWSPDSPQHLNHEEHVELEFSNFGHFKAPFKRPSCNPFVKDERYKKLNSVNEDDLRGGRVVPCDSQVLNYPFRDLASQGFDQNQRSFPFAFSQATSPKTASGMTFFSFVDQNCFVGNVNSSWQGDRALNVQSIQQQYSQQYQQPMQMSNQFANSAPNNHHLFMSNCSYQTGGLMYPLHQE